MKRKFLTCAAALLSIALLQAHAQTDTTKYDLGRIRLQKKFTQAVTIKASDLEKIPFTTLSEALNTWLYGTYGNKGTYVTVVDGTLISDINAYSIYDIDEITLIQNSLTQLNGIAPSQIMLLVKTKRGGRNKSGLNVNGQTNLITGRNSIAGSTDKSTTNYYHQYYISAYTNTIKTQSGVSAGFLQSTLPAFLYSGLDVKAPYSLTRYRLNAYMDTKIDKQNTLSINAGYAPQSNNYEFSYQSPSILNTTQNANNHINEHILYGNIKLNSTIAGTLQNDFSTSVQQYHFHGKNNTTITQKNNTTTTAVNEFASDTTDINTAYLIKDDLYYQLNAGGWQFEPNVNFTFRNFKDSINKQLNYINTVAGPTSRYTTTTIYYLTQKLALLTPSATISYKNAFLLQGGFQKLLNTSKQAVFVGFQNIEIKPSTIYPFAALSINLSEFGNQHNHNTQLSIYGSYAKSLVVMNDYTGKLSDITTAGNNNNNVLSDTNLPYNIYYIPNYNPYQTYNQLQAGVKLSLLKSKLSFSYNYSVRQYNIQYPVQLSYGSGYFITYLYPNVRIDTHRLGIDMDITHSANFSWVSTLNGSVIKPVIQNGLTFIPFNNNHIVTGGFVNRIAYKKLTVGLDMLYRLHEETYTYTNAGVSVNNINSFDIKNLYVGYQLRMKKVKSLEVFVNARNILQNTKSDITDNRRYFGAGFKLGL